MQQDKKQTKRKSTANRKLTVEELRAELEAKHTNSIVKDLNKYGNDYLEKSHYRWWWEFVQVGVKNNTLRAELAEDRVTADTVAKLIDDFVAPQTDLGIDDFEYVENFGGWWERIGHQLFTELAVPYINPIEIRVDEDHGVNVPKIVLEVPLNISRKLLQQQFNAIIDHYYPEKFMRHAASTAVYKIEPATKDRFFEFGYMLAVWQHRQREDKMPLWEVHCLAIEDEDLRNKLRNNENTGDEREQYGKKVDRAYRQADELMRNALLGKFPKDDEFQKARGRD
jgi:hypothetical protein